jgi:Peptidase family M48
MHVMRAICGAAALCLAGCVSVSFSSKGDPEFETRFKASTEAILDRSKAAEAEALKKRATVSSDIDAYIRRHFAKADELVTAHASQVRNASRNNIFDEYGKRRLVMLDFTLNRTANMEVVESNVATASAFPTGTVLVTRTLAQGFTVTETGFDSVLLGVLMHELIHVRDGHALEQWSTADGRTAWARDQVLSGLSAITSIIPFFSVKMSAEYSLTFGAVKELPVLSEFAADFGAVALLKANGFDSDAYIRFLTGIASMPAKEGKENALLRKRVDCLNAFSRTSYEQTVHAVIAGSNKAREDVSILTLPKQELVVSLMNSPEELAKLFTEKSDLSPEGRREALVNEMRKWMFMSCALRHTFPKAPVADGVMETPTFDFVILTRYQ